MNLTAKTIVDLVLETYKKGRKKPEGHSNKCYSIALLKGWRNTLMIYRKSNCSTSSCIASGSYWGLSVTQDTGYYRKGECLPSYCNRDTGIWQIKATEVNCCSKFINRLRKNKSGLQTKTEGNASNIRELRHNRNTTLKCNAHRYEL